MAAGPETTSTYADLLLEMKGPLVENYPKYSVLLSELKRNTSRKNFDGSSVRVPIIRNVKQGTGATTESATINSARNIRTTKANITLATLTHAVQVSRRLKSVSDNSVTSWGEAMKLEMQLAEEAMPRVMNEFLNGNGDALLGTVSDSTASATHTVTGVSWYQLYPGRVVTIAKKSDGTVRATAEISSVTETTATSGTVVFTASWDSSTDGANADGLYIEGSYGNAPQGITQATGSGSFEGITIGADWAAVDGRNGDTSAADLSISLLDGAVRRRGRNGQANSGFWLGDPAVVDKFGQTLLAQSRWAGDKAKLETGWEGISYNGELLIKEYDCKAQRVVYVPKDDVTFYSTTDGPDWDDEDGSVFKRFTRALPVEAWLVDEVQLGFHRLNRFVYLDNLNQAV